MYSFKSRVRYSETDREGKLSFGALLDYFQDCSTFHSETLGLGMEYLRRHKMAWVLSAWQIVAKRSPRLCEEIEIGTFPYAFRGFLGYRNFFLKDCRGEYPARANSLWTLLDTESMKPVRPTEEMLEGYVLEEKLPMDYAPRKIMLPEDMCHIDEMVIKRHHIDSNNHVNNGQYVRIAMEYLPEDYKIKQMRAEYKRQARLHDTVYVTAGKAGDVYTVALCAAPAGAFGEREEEPYAVVEFSTGGQE